MKDLIWQAREVYQKLSDQISKKVFMARLQYSITQDMSIIMNLDPIYRNLSSDIEYFKKSIIPGNRNVIFGAGRYGQAFAQAFSKGFESLEAKIETFVDNYRKNQVDDITGLPIQSLEEFKNSARGLENVTFFIAIIDRNEADKVKKQLVIENGVNENNIVMCIPDWRNNSSQYFDLFMPGENEVFIDCGCYDGGTCYRFAGWCGSAGYDHIYSFEPDEKSFARCKEVLEPLGKCELFPYGVSNKREKVYFASNGNEDARIISEERALSNEFERVDYIETISLDQFLKEKRITFIKMDIEGAEWNAVLGAQNIIRDQKPRLAISVYHTPDDFVRIPKLLLDIRPDYKLYFRQYSLLSNETILYAE